MFDYLNAHSSWTFILILSCMICRVESKNKTRPYGNNSKAFLNFSVQLFSSITCSVSSCAHIVGGCTKIFCNEAKTNCVISSILSIVLKNYFPHVFALTTIVHSLSSLNLIQYYLGEKPVIICVQISWRA